MPRWLTLLFRPKKPIEARVDPEPESQEEQAVAGLIVDALMSWGRTRSQLERELSYREKTYAAALRNREGRP